MNRDILPSIISGILLALVIVLLPDQYLFSKTVSNSFWIKYFPLPFGAGWFITFVALTPAIWVTSSLSKAAKSGIIALITSVIVAVPISVIMIGDVFTLNNAQNQYIWVGVICLPPYLLHFLLRWIVSLMKNQWLPNRSKPTPKNGAF